VLILNMPGLRLAAPFAFLGLNDYLFLRGEDAGWVEVARVSAEYTFVRADRGRVGWTRCRTDSARLIAHRVLGLPVGLAHIAVTCSEGGASRQGRVRHSQK
jgi:hypothetical protein